MIPFLLANWRWIVPVVLLVGIGIDDGIHRIEVANLRSEIAADKAAQQKAIADAQAKADSLANELIIAQAASMAVTEKTKTVYVDRIRNAPVTTACPNSPAIRAALDGVRDFLNGSSPDTVGGAPKALH